MKRMFFRIISLMLVLAMTMGGIAMPVWAEETEEPSAVVTSDGHCIAYPSLLSQFDFPQNWSKKALEFCVGNRIIVGKDGGLAPDDYITRAETATILIRLLEAKPDPNILSRFQDVQPGQWYYDAISAAVSVGLMKGTSDTTIAPNEKLTREDACVLLSRAFGILPLDAEGYAAFSDGDTVSAYAQVAVSALAERGTLKGYGDNTIRPKANITRAEFAKLIYGLVTHICDSADQLPSWGQVIYRGKEPIPEGYSITGSLTLGYGYPGSTLNALEVTDRLVLRCAPGKSMELVGCSVPNLSIASRMNVSSDSAVTRIFIGDEGSSVNVPADGVYVFGGCTLSGDCGIVKVVGDGICVTFNGRAKNCYIYGNYCTLQGSGYSDTVDVYGRNCKVTLKSGKMTDHIYVSEYNNSLNTVQTVNSWYNYQRQEPYSTATMEGFVNKKGYSSSTEYLIWVSTTTTTVNVFKGSQGSWKLERSMACALGAPYSPTVKGTFKTFLRDNEWDFGSYKCRWVTYFYNGYAFHSRKWSPNYSYLVDPSINCLVSAGCVRMYDEDCYYIYSTIPYRTTVVVY